MNHSLLRNWFPRLRRLWPTRPPWRRYRVTPRANPAVFRRELLGHIRTDLRQAGLLPQSNFHRSTTL